MRAYRTEKIISQNGALDLKALPFKAGELVEIIILPLENRVNETNSYSLKGKVIKYDQPTEPVAQNDWDVLK